MSKRKESGIVHLEYGQIAVAQMLRGTSESSFTLLRGVPSNSEKRIDEYLWSEVTSNGETKKLTQQTNPIVLDVPGTYKFRNDGFDDEDALIDITAYNKRVETTTYV